MSENIAPTHLFTAKEQALGGFSVRRLLPHAQCRMVGPWIFLDHIGPVQFDAGQGIDVRPHPHINLATVTYLFDGELLHRDSLGNVTSIRPNEINLMVAGRGIVHSERTAPELRAQGHSLHGLQLWLALPDTHEEMPPAFYHFEADQLPKTEVQGVPVRVMMGNAYGVSSPVPTYSPTVYLEAQLQAGQSLTLPAEIAEQAVYVAKGQLRLHNTELHAHHLAVFHTAQNVTVTATENTQLAIIGGDPVGKRFIWWNFVSSRAERIEQAKADWQTGQFPAVPDEVEWIPLPESIKG